MSTGHTPSSLVPTHHLAGLLLAYQVEGGALVLVTDRRLWEDDAGRAMGERARRPHFVQGW